MLRGDIGPPCPPYPSCVTGSTSLPILATTRCCTALSWVVVTPWLATVNRTSDLPDRQPLMSSQRRTLISPQGRPLIPATSTSTKLSNSPVPRADLGVSDIPVIEEAREYSRSSPSPVFAGRLAPRPNGYRSRLVALILKLDRPTRNSSTTIQL